MTARERVARTGRALAAIVMARAFMFGAAATLTVWVVMTALLALVGQSHPAWAWGAALLTGTLVAVAAARRSGGLRLSPGAVALWVEEQLPSLRYALVTAIEGPAPSPTLLEEVRASDWTPQLRRAASRSLRLPLVAMVMATALALAAREIAPSLRSVGEAAVSRRVGAPATGTLEIVANVRPPAYSRLPAQTVRNPASLRALEGSVVTFEAPDDTLRAMLGNTMVSPDQRPDRLALRVGPQAVAVRLQGRRGTRLVALEPVPDSSPRVTLRTPARDTVLRAASGSVALRADVHDDLGVRRAWFEYIVSSGEGEAFTFRSGVLGQRTPGGARDLSFEAALPLEGLSLGPGDIVHLRAVAIDLRDDSVRALGSSETRVIRIARAGEFDSVAIEAAAPPEADRSLLSQRMLINLAEALVAKRPRLAPAPFAEESRGIARDQARLRRQVGEIVFSRLGDDPSGEHFHGDGHEHSGEELRPALTPDELLKAAENATAAAAGQLLDLHEDSPIVSINRPLLEAYNAMWDAGRELEQAAPEQALPHMYRALDAIQRARAAERLYLRSRPPRAVVDVDQVRLQGRDRGTPTARDPREAVGSSRSDLLARLAGAVALAAEAPGAAADSLLLLRIELLDGHAQAAAALGEAAEGLRTGTDATTALLRARRALDPAAAGADSLSRWRGAR